MFGFSSHGQSARNDASPLRRQGFERPYRFFPDPRLAAWAILVGRPDLAEFNPRGVRHRGELDDIDFAAAHSAARRPSLIRRVVAALSGGRTVDPARAMSGGIAAGDRRSPETRYTDGTRFG